MRSPQNIFRLGIKELRCFRGDTVLLLLVVYAFTYGIYGRATGISSELTNASIAVVDEDRSMVSGRIVDAFLPPAFLAPREIPVSEVDPAMDSGQFTFVLDIPPDFERDLLARRMPRLQINVDATAVMQAGVGVDHISSVVASEIGSFLAGEPVAPSQPVQIAIRMKFNPNLTSSWFMGIMELINSVTMLAVILAGGAVIREKEHGTMDHLLVMPLRSWEIMLAKIWANGLVILVAASASLLLVIRWWLHVPITGSIPIFVVGTALYLFAATSLGIFLATLADTMPQFGLLFIMVVLPMCLLSGGNTPLDAMPTALQHVMQISPSTHYVAFAQAILYRQANLALVWKDLFAIGVIGGICLLGALWRFRCALIGGHSA